MNREEFMNLKKLINHLNDRGATFTGEVVGNAKIMTFNLPGEDKANGRLYQKKDGSFDVWHVNAKSGLNLTSEFTRSLDKTIGSFKVPAYNIKPDQVDKLQPGNGLLTRKATEQNRSSNIHQSYDLAAFKNSVNFELEKAGWKFHHEKGGVQYWNDGNGSTPAQRVKIDNGIASVWSFRGDVDLPEPFQVGRITENGNRSMFVTAKSLEIRKTGVTYERPVFKQPERSEINKDTVNFVMNSWNNGIDPKADHYQLTKANAKLETTSFKQFPNTEETRKRFMTNDLIVPLFRDDGKGGIELSGGQRLLAKKFKDNDKFFLEGTQSQNAFSPIPPHALMDGKPDINNWIKSLGEGAKNKPLIISEGFGTGQAIYQSGAGAVIAAINSGNIENVAKWVRDSGIDKHFSEVIIASELDVARDDQGRLKSNAIPKAILASKENNTKIALPDIGEKHGTDARDILGKAGTEGVRDYISKATTPDKVLQRPDMQYVKQHRVLDKCNQR